MANSSGTHNQDANHASSSFNGVNPTNGHESSGTPLKHNPGISTDWSVEEQAVLEDGLKEYRAEQNIVRYAKIAMQLQNKTVRDVALRCRWMTKKENSKRRKEDILARKTKEKKERASDLLKQSHFMASPNVLPYSTTMIPAAYDDELSYNVIGGVTGELLEQNAKAFNHISTNLSTMQVQENISLLCQTRDNILKIMNELNDLPEVMKQMPPLPVKLNEDLANTILPRPNLPMK